MAGLATSYLNLNTAVGSRKSAQPLDAPRKCNNWLITQKVTTQLLNSLCTSIACTAFSRSTAAFRFKQIGLDDRIKKFAANYAYQGIVNLSQMWLRLRVELVTSSLIWMIARWMVCSAFNFRYIDNTIFLYERVACVFDLLSAGWSLPSSLFWLAHSFMCSYPF